jgi:energy-coupling factor transporter ATP-binding protein EcfA2
MESKEAARLLEVCTAARDELDSLRFHLELPSSEAARQRAEACRAQLDNYVLPRLVDIDAPALIVIGGSTGSGKSTLTNSLLGEHVSAAGVLRPTTRSPVLVCHPDTMRWFDGPRVLGDLARVSGTTTSEGHTAAQTESDQRLLELVTTTNIAPTIAILDAPDIDSVVDANRELAAHLLDAADVWLFVTTAARYADALPWKFLQEAAQRGVSLAMVLNRVPPGAGAEIGEDLRKNLVAHDLHVELFTIDEQPLVDANLPASAIASLSTWISRIGEDQALRAQLVLGTLSGTLNEVQGQLNGLADAAEAQNRALEQLANQVDQEYGRAGQRISADLEFGAVLRGEVLARWQDVVGTGELLRQLESSIGRLRDKFTAALKGRPTQAAELEGAIELGV